MVLVLIWAAFVMRATYYCVQQPMWEGLDEWAHFAYIQQLAEMGSIPHRTDPVPQNIFSSLQLAPLSRSAAEAVAGSITHEEFWRLGDEDRERRQTQLRMLGASVPPGTPVLSVNATALQYEAQQPPFYYALLTAPYLAFRFVSLPAQVLALRLLSVLLASAVVFVTYNVSRMLLHGSGAQVIPAVLVASLPGFFVNICKIGNDGLAAVLNGLVLLLTLRAVTSGGRIRTWVSVGFVLGAALLTKASSLAFIPLVPVAAIMAFKRAPTSSGRWTILAGASLSLSATATVAGWWYWHVWHTTGTLAGEQLHVAAWATATLGNGLIPITHVEWGRVIDSAAFTHIWVGWWSFLTVRSWMYRVFEALAITTLVGMLAILLRRSGSRTVQGSCNGSIIIAALSYAALCAAVAYHALVVHLAKGISTGAGWYLNAAVTA